MIGGGLLYMYSGAYNIAATDEHTGVVRWMLNTTQVQSVRSHAEDVEGITLPSDSAALQRGLQSFQEMCVICHGAPGVERGWMGQGMNPTPPDLSEMAEMYSSEELYWIVANGLKMAGMPALSPTHSREEILEVVAFVEQLPQVSEQEYEALTSQLRQSQPATQQGQTDGQHGHTH